MTSLRGVVAQLEADQKALRERLRHLQTVNGQLLSSLASGGGNQASSAAMTAGPTVDTSIPYFVECEGAMRDWEARREANKDELLNRLAQLCKRQSQKLEENQNVIKALQASAAGASASTETAAAIAKRLASNLQAKDAELTQRDVQLQQLRSELAQKDRSLATLNSQTSGLQAKLDSLAQKFQSYKSRYVELKRELGNLNAISPKVVAETCLAKVRQIGQLLVECTQKYMREAELRKKYFNQVQELKGNIRVFCRVRPLIPLELARNATDITSFPCKKNIEVMGPGGRPKRFEYDQVFAPDVSQAKIFSKLEALVTSVLDGYNVCVFAYGQTGSGKTFTMQGPMENPGVNVRAVDELFARANRQSEDMMFRMEMSFLEIYNESINDLLASRGEGRNLELHMADERLGEKNMGSATTVLGLTSVEVVSLQEVFNHLGRGMQNRATAATNMNDTSSRSHSVLSIKVHATNRILNTQYFGQLHLVDLAGSERISRTGCTGQALLEAQNINKSLLSLGDVISALVRKDKHIPYRNSKLTFLLADSLGGNSKTLMFVNISPASDNSGETICSLNFASRARCVELGAAKKNTDGAQSGKGGGDPKLEAVNQKLQQRVEHLKGELDNVRAEHAERMQATLAQIGDTHKKEINDREKRIKMLETELSRKGPSLNPMASGEVRGLQTQLKEAVSNQRQSAARIAALEDKLKQRERELDIARRQTASRNGRSSVRSDGRYMSGRSTSSDPSGAPSRPVSRTNGSRRVVSSAKRDPSRAGQPPASASTSVSAVDDKTENDPDEDLGWDL
eukprot:gnl/Spiro4/28598_TR14144_c0_g1_i1.p1 gnl/Spiro4/28598_TR14144_c0_g1~~gnl/Spiro4/28598_TR14144_c0_g1_i1.p1  ORF type:complete len:799 (-),score=282.82 gnl/Spiro4/28598_TR14144_c0_g1_i1:54-2450(-)